MDACFLGNGLPSPRALAFLQGDQHFIEFHVPDYAYQPNRCQAYPPKPCLHDDAAMATKEEDIRPDSPQANIRALIAASGLSVNAWSNSYGLTQTTINRIIKGELDPTTAQLRKIAEAIGGGVQAWQFLAPNMGDGLHTLVQSEAGGARLIPVSTSNVKRIGERPIMGAKIVTSLPGMPSSKAPRLHRKKDK